MADLNDNDGLGDLPSATRPECSSSDDARTAELGSRPAAQSPADPAVGGLIAERYRLEAVLGEGGMGRVYRATDLQLQRPVAVKLLHPGPGESADRLLREARAQARVNHDHVAKVLEAGASDGSLYIAMQLVDGPTLKQVAGSLSLDEKVDVVRQAADAVHAAHLEGLVHRDLKPGNIMLERHGDGAWKAYVVDFGLVRDLDAEAGLSATAVAGTPHYMAPEQIRSENAHIDWRTDVYALGATLFELLAGTPPFHGSSGVEILVRALEEPARFPRSIRHLPRDLQAIALHCLEKEPQDRYGSARELAEDLGRFQRGETVSARPVPTAIRLLRAARRRPRLTAATLLALVAVAVLAGLWLRASLRSRHVAELSRRFGEEVAAMESIGRLAAMQPLHDIRRERALIRARMEALAAQVDRLGAVAEGPGRLALGRGWLALGDPEAARRELQAAWDEGFRTPGLAAALGQALAESYRAAVDEARAIKSRVQTENRMAVARRELRDPAVAALVAAGGSSAGSSLWVQGQLRLLEERYDDALASVRAAREAEPWRYETWRIEGEASVEQAESLTRKDAWQEALATFERAGVAYRAGIDAARSDVELREAECHRRVRVMATDDGRELPPDERAAWALEACNEALAVQPESVVAHVEIARVLRQLAQKQQLAGADPRPRAAQGIAAARRAAAVDPRSLEARREIAFCQETQASWEGLHGLDPRPVAGEAITTLKAVLADSPDHAPSMTQLGGLYDLVADWENEHGQDPRAALAASFRYREEYLRLVPEDAAGHHNLGLSYLRAGSAAGRWGLETTEALSKAVEHFRAAAARRPDLHQAYNGEGSALRLLADQAQSRDEDPRPLLGQAIAAFGRAISIRPDHGWALFNRSIALRIRARDALERGGDPLPDILASRADLERARELMPDDPDVSSSLAATLSLQAEAVQKSGGDPRPLLDEALRQSELTVTRNPGEAFAWCTQAEAFLLRARSNHERGGDFGPDLERAFRSISRGHEVDQNYAQLWIVEGEAWLDRVEWSPGSPADAGRRAQAALARALELEPRTLNEYPDLFARAEKVVGDVAGIVSPRSAP